MVFVKSVWLLQVKTVERVTEQELLLSRNIINEENGVIDLIYIYDKSDTDNINSEFISTLVSEARDIAESDSK